MLTVAYEAQQSWTTLRPARVLCMRWLHSSALFSDVCFVDGWMLYSLCDISPRSCSCTHTASRFSYSARCQSLLSLVCHLFCDYKAYARHRGLSRTRYVRIYVHACSCFTLFIHATNERDTPIRILSHQSLVSLCFLWVGALIFMYWFLRKNFAHP